MVTAYAVSMAKRLDARVTVVRPRRDGAGLTDGSLEARLELARGDQESRKAKAREALEAFGEAAKAAGVEAEVLLPEDWQDPSRDQISGLRARIRFHRGRPGGAGQVAEKRRDRRTVAHRQRAARSGRPRDPARSGDFRSRGRRMGRQLHGGARVRRAMPILERADRVEIVSVTGPNTPHAIAQGGERLAARLSRGGVAASFKRLPSEEDPANAILSYVADTGADMLVAGGYGHSRLREALFGGVTRTFLSSQTVPMFLSR